MERVQKAYKENNIALLFTSSDLYSPYVGVLIQSILENSSIDNNYDILIFETDISANNKNNIKSLIGDRTNISIRFIDVSETMNSYVFKVISKTHSKYNFYRLSVLDVLPEYEKIIYMDSDIVVNGDIADLFNISVDNYYLAATRCSRMLAHSNNPNPIGSMKIPMREYLEQDLGLDTYLDYFNSGVMLWNLDEMRKSFTSQQLLSISESGVYPTVEQDVLNKLCEGKVKYLPFIWNLLCLSPKGVEKDIPEPYKTEYFSSRNCAKVWHYCGNNVPCNNPTVDHFWYFWHYAAKTPFYSLLLERQEKANREKYSEQKDKKVGTTTTLSNSNVTTNIGKQNEAIVKHTSCQKILRERIKKLLRKTNPAYRVALRNEEQIYAFQELMVKEFGKIRGGIGGGYNTPSIKTKTKWGKLSMTAEYELSISCLALEIHETHKASFSEFKNCNLGKDVVIVATGPSMKYYNQIPGIAHIGVNAAYKNPAIKLDYFFITDFENRVEEFEDLKNYDFIKFFGQYSPGIYRDRFQASEKMILENNGRRFFQGAPSEDIPLNIEFFPLMGFYTISFQAIQFALYTNPKRIFLVGCDCSSDGYFDGRKENKAIIPKWAVGYEKLKGFVEHFYPETEIISINPVGLKGLFHDVFTSNYLADHPEQRTDLCEVLERDFFSEKRE